MSRLDDLRRVVSGELPGNATCPVFALAGRENRGTALYDTAQWVAEKIGSQVVEVPGMHGGYFDQPKEFADVIRPLLTNVS